MSAADNQLAHPPGHWRRRLATLARWLHVYLSMVAFAILLFFAITGVTLNHVDWFDQTGHPATSRGSLDTAWLKGPGETGVDKLQVVERLRSAHGIKGAVAEFTVDDEQCQISFRGPGYTGDATVRRATGDYELTETRMGLIAVLNDLHKGRDSGRAWSWVIDLSGVLLALVSLSGFALIFFIRRRRVGGLVVAILGAATCGLIYFWLVP